MLPLQVYTFPRRAGGVGTGAPDLLYCLWNQVDGAEDSACIENVVSWPFLSRTLDPVLPDEQRAPAPHNTLFHEQWEAAKVRLAGVRGSLLACGMVDQGAGATNQPALVAAEC